MNWLETAKTNLAFGFKELAEVVYGQSMAILSFACLVMLSQDVWKYLIWVPHELYMLHEGQTEALALGFLAYCETISIIQYNHLSLAFMFKVNTT